MMNPNRFRDPLTFPPAPSSGQHLSLSYFWFMTYKTDIPIRLSCALSFVFLSAAVEGDWTSYFYTTVDTVD